MNYADELRHGQETFILLAVLTIVEFVVAILTQAWWLLVIAALAKALVVLYNFMHLSRVLSDDGGHE